MLDRITHSYLWDVVVKKKIASIQHRNAPFVITTGKRNICTMNANSFHCSSWEIVHSRVYLCEVFFPFFIKPVLPPTLTRISCTLSINLLSSFWSQLRNIFWVWILDLIIHQSKWYVTWNISFAVLYIEDNGLKISLPYLLHCWRLHLNMV